MAPSANATEPLILRWWNRELRFHKLERFGVLEALSWPAIATGAFVGAYSHVALDSLMHADMAPWWPWLAAHTVPVGISTGMLHLYLLGDGPARGIRVVVAALG